MMMARQRSNEGLQVGDTLVSIWGYSMRLVDFYKVTALNGKTMVTVQPVNGIVVKDEEPLWGITHYKADKNAKPCGSPSRHTVYQSVGRAYDGTETKYPTVEVGYQQFAHKVTDFNDVYTQDEND